MIFTVHQPQQKCCEQGLAVLPGIHRPDQSIRPGQQKRSVPAAREDRLPPEADRQPCGLLSQGHEGHSHAGRGMLQALPHHKPMLFSFFFSLLLTYAFGSSDYGVYLHTRSDGRL